MSAHLNSTERMSRVCEEALFLIDLTGRLYQKEGILMLNIKTNNQGNCERGKVKASKSGNLLKSITDEKQEVAHLATASLQ